MMQPALRFTPLGHLTPWQKKWPLESKNESQDRDFSEFCWRNGVEENLGIKQGLLLGLSERPMKYEQVKCVQWSWG